MFAPQRRQPARQARKRSASANARRSGRSRGRVNYNEEAMLGHVRSVRGACRLALWAGYMSLP